MVWRQYSTDKVYCICMSWLDVIPQCLLSVICFSSAAREVTLRLALAFLFKDIADLLKHLD